MKRILSLIAAVSLICSCGEKNADPVQPVPDKPDVENPGNDKPGPEPEETLASKLVGEWHCASSDIDADIFLAFADDASFKLYQKIGEGAYRLYQGTWSLDEKTSVLTGKYNDGNDWGSSYTIALSEDKNSMTLTPSEGTEKQSYSREVIPADVKEGCVVVVKSGSEAPML